MRGSVLAHGSKNKSTHSASTQSASGQISQNLEIAGALKTIHVGKCKASQVSLCLLFSQLLSALNLLPLV